MLTTVRVPSLADDREDLAGKKAINAREAGA
jgi:hypothetical protein